MSRRSTEVLSVAAVLNLDVRRLERVWGSKWRLRRSSCSGGAGNKSFKIVSFFCEGFIQTELLAVLREAGVVLKSQEMVARRQNFLTPE